jgi:hypothetical protein
MDLSLATKPFKRNLRRAAVKRDAVVLSSSSSSSSAAFFSSAALNNVKLHIVPVTRIEKLTFLVDKLDVTSDKLDDPISLCRAFLYGKNASQHLQNHLLKYALPNEPDSIAPPNRLSVPRGFCLDLVERDKILLVVCDRYLSLIQNPWDG